MSVKRQTNWLEQQRIETSTMRGFESSIANDFDDLYRGLIIGENKTYLIRGFTINMTGAIGNNASSLQMVVEDSAILHGTDANAGTLLTIPSGASDEVLNSGTNNKVAGSFVPGATNQVSVKFTRTTDATTTDLVAFWSPATQLEFTKSVPLARVLDFQIVVSSTGFEADALPIALVVTDANNNVISVTDQRPELLRLGTGGTLTPDPQFEFPWTEGRNENPVTSTSSVSPFEGGDKQLKTMKEWMDAVMTMFKEIKGTPFWYSGGAGSWPGSIGSLRADTAHSVISGRGNIAHSSSTPGRINWSRDFFIRFLSGRLTYKIGANISTSDISLADNEVAYLNLVRDQDVSPNLIFTNGSAVVQSVGSVAWTNVIGLQVGDFIKVASLFDDKYFQVLTIDSNSQVTLTDNYTETSTGAAGAKARFAFGVYGTNTGSAARDIVVANRKDVELTEDTYWLFFRDDNGSNKAKVFARFLGSELEEGETRDVSDNTTSQLLAYLGSPSEMESNPSYVGAVDRFEITQIKAVPPADITVGQAFTIFSANDATQYYGWFSDAAAPGVGDPLLAGTGVEIQVDFGTPDTEVQVAVLIAAAFNAIGDFAAGVPTTNVLTIVNAAEGNSTDATNVDVGGAFEIESITQGASGTKNGQQNYNSVEGDSLTARASRLTSMMADKAQDKTIHLTSDHNNTTNTTNAANQDITFTGGTPQMTVVMPSSANNGIIGMGGTLSLAVNQAAIFQVDRNAALSVANLTGLNVVNIDSINLGENDYVFAYRLSGTDVFLWDNIKIAAGATVPSASFLQTIIQQNENNQLIKGGTWDWDLGSTTLTWSASAFVQIPSLADNVNEISAGNNSSLADGEVLYVNIKRTSGASILTVNRAAIASVVLNDNTFVIARRIGSVVLVGEDTLLIDGEARAIGSSISNQNATYIGASNAADSDPNYTGASSGSLNLPNFNTANGESLPTRMAKITAMLADANQDKNLAFDPGVITWLAGDITVTGAFLSISGTAVGAGEVPINTLGSTALADNSALYVDISRTSNSALTFAVATLASLTPNQQRLILIRNINGDLVI